MSQLTFSPDRNKLFGCDTMVALPSATADGQVLFAKNSDRKPEESQPLVQVESARHEPGSKVRCQFFEIPQVDVTHKHVGSRPYWCWGYEHGFNEHQVAIGNEALWSRVAEANELKLTGMDLVRLGLERGRDASEAVEAITGLVTTFGQGRFVGNSDASNYDNGFIVADPKQAYVIETAGHEWAVKRVDRAIGISNVHSIGADWISLSPAAEQEASGNGWWDREAGRLDFRAAYLDAGSTSSGPYRRARLCAFLADRDGEIDLRTAMRLASDHSDGKDPHEPHCATMPAHGSVCMHYGDDVTSNTAATLIAHLCDDGSRLPVYWCSLYSPCLGIFLPTFSQGEIPGVLSVGGKQPNDGSPWWLFRALEKTTRRGTGFDQAAVDAIRAEWAPVQNDLIASAYGIALEANDLIRNGATARANEVVTEYMASNTDLMLRTIKGMLSRLAPATLAPAR